MIETMQRANELEKELKIRNGEVLELLEICKMFVYGYSPKSSTLAKCRKSAEKVMGRIQGNYPLTK